MVIKNTNSDQFELFGEALVVAVNREILPLDVAVVS
jgi:hypothetical protein